MNDTTGLCFIFITFWMNYTTGLEMQGAANLLRKYCSLLCSHVTDILPVAASMAAISTKHFSLVCKIISKDVTGEWQAGLSLQMALNVVLPLTIF